jgi:cytochrome b pre-mRNA-processing protein 3
MTFLARVFGGRHDRDAYRPLYDAIVNAGRARNWYVEGEVPDTIDGRFDMIAAVMALTLLRLEKEGENARGPSVLLTELFIDDMDGSMRQLGIGDLMVGKHVGRLTGALGGRLGAFREDVEAGRDFTATVAKNIFHDAPPNEDALRFVSRGLGELHQRLQTVAAADLLKGAFPA